MAVKEDPALSCKLAIAASIITTDFVTDLAFGSSTAASMASQRQSFNDIYFVIDCNILFD